MPLFPMSAARLALPAGAFWNKNGISDVSAGPDTGGGRAWWSLWVLSRRHSAGGGYQHHPQNCPIVPRTGERPTGVSSGTHAGCWRCCSAPQALQESSQQSQAPPVLSRSHGRSLGCVLDSVCAFLPVSIAVPSAEACRVGWSLCLLSFCSQHFLESLQDVLGVWEGFGWRLCHSQSLVLPGCHRHSCGEQI